MNQPSFIPTQQQFLSFALSVDQWALLSTVQLIEILQVDSSSIAEIPGMPAAVMGVYPTQGQLLWMVDLVQLNGLNSRGVPRQFSVLKVSSQWGNLGCFVQQVGSLITIDSTAIERPQILTSPMAARLQVPDTYLQGIWTNSEGTALPILDAEAIAQQVRSF